MRPVGRRRTPAGLASAVDFAYLWRMRARRSVAPALAPLVAALALGCAGSSAPPRGPEGAAAAAPAPAPAELGPVLGDLAVDVDLTPAEAYQVFTIEVGKWWDHTFAEAPYLLRIDARPGGAFVEFFDGEGNGAEHARVIFAKQGESLRMVGPLGLSGRGVELVQSLTFAARDGGGSKVALHLEVIGSLDAESRAAVLQVWEHFLGAFQAYAKARGSKLGAAPRFAQPPVAEAARVGLGFFSHLTRGAARNHVHADDFAIDADAELVGLRFWGHAEGKRAADLANVSDFSLRIHSATPEATPGPIVYEQFFALADTKAAPTGRRGTASAGKPGPLEVGHEVELAAPLQLRAGATYFVSIAAVRRDGAGEPWMWSDGQLRNGRSYSHPLGDPRWQAIDDTDSAFELILRP